LRPLNSVSTHFRNGLNKASDRRTTTIGTTFGKSGGRSGAVLLYFPSIDASSDLVPPQLPFEQLKRAARTSQKYIEKELTNLSTNVAELANKTTSGAIQPEDASRSLDAMLERLQKLKRKLEETKQEELTYTTRTKQRLDHLDELGNIQYMDSDDYERWSRIRLDRMLVDYVLRNGCMNTAEKLAKDAEIEVNLRVSRWQSLAGIFDRTNYSASRTSSTLNSLRSRKLLKVLLLVEVATKLWLGVPRTDPT